MTETVNILLVEDEEPVRFALTEALAKQGYAVQAVTSAEEGLRRLVDEAFDIAVTDVKLPGLSGLEFVSRAKAHDPSLILIVMSGVATTREAMEALNRGAYDFFTKPFRVAELDVVMRRALEKRQLQREVHELRARLQQRYAVSGLIGQSGRMQEVLTLLAKVIPSTATVLLLGESGTGKERVAEVIHRNGARAERPLIKVNCAAIPEGLLESELFGHERGAFTGATAQKPGKFELANGGTIFLDEVGDMASSTQAKMLRVLEDREIFRVGAAKPIRVDVRIIAATNKDLAEAVRRKEFREDLYYRLNVFPIVLPPLRERAGDIPLLVEHVLAELRQTVGKAVEGISAEAMERLMAYSWPGNVRELRNCLERAALMAEAKGIQAEDLPLTLRLPPEPRPAGDGHSLDDRVAEVERRWITEALREARGVQAQAAKNLGIAERSLWYRVKKYGIDPDQFRRV
ncbi:MAG: sigma-54-dependent Fis family transcriptional regulator [Candidatus Rokubacteria bacterium]|nr:sigma-54-dependent Fis family transcriptional regulator [Candidatus Rokubacteria bacterium]